MKTSIVFLLETFYNLTLHLKVMKTDDCSCIYGSLDKHPGAVKGHIH
jgi:hypothetical protein